MLCLKFPRVLRKTLLLPKDPKIFFSSFYKKPQMDKQDEDQSKMRKVYPGLTIGEADAPHLETKFEGKYKDAPAWKAPSILKIKDPEHINVYVVNKPGNEETVNFCLKVLDLLQTYNAKIFVPQNNLEELDSKTSKELKAILKPYTEDQELNIDLVVTIGGDGTILYALKNFQQKVAPPVLAYSRGTLNYLANFSMKNYQNSLTRVLETIKAGEPLEMEKRYRLHCELRHDNNESVQVYHALNEIVVGSGTSPFITSVECSLEGKPFGRFDGDGITVSTATGSTAYQVSAGGPIVGHLMSCMTISPIAALSLSTRPVVLPSAMRLTFRLKNRNNKEGILNLDGQVTVIMESAHELSVTGSGYYVPFIVGKSNDTLDNWISRLRNMLGWNKNFSTEEGE